MSEGKRLSRTTMERFLSSELIAQRMTTADAVTEIAAIKQQIVVSGSHDDSELEQLDDISAAVVAGTMTPEKAIEEARTREAQRQNYH